MNAAGETDDELLSEGIEPVTKATKLRGKLVVESHRRDSGDEAKRRREERLGDTGCYDSEVGGALTCNIAEGVHDTPNGTEEADKG